jgi:ADP-heptose:LPS heptosyltransferase
MHLAAAYGVPCAIVFAAIDRRGRWFPIGEQHRPVYHQVECAVCWLTVCIEKGKICIESITVEEMFTAAIEAIEKRPGKSAAGDQARVCIAEVRRD